MENQVGHQKFGSRRGNGISTISLIIPPKDQISRVSKMYADEFGINSNIKSRVNRLSVLKAITLVRQRLKLYNKVPPNGLVVYCGTNVTEEGKEKKVNIDIEPFKSINTSLYLCDDNFHTEALTALLSNDSKFGFIVIDGSGALFGTLHGNTREVLHKFTVDLPKKHSREPQYSLRFARLTSKKRLNYVRKVAETAVQLVVSNDKVNVVDISYREGRQSNSQRNQDTGRYFIASTNIPANSALTRKIPANKLATLDIVMDKSQEGSQFVKGFGGIGGILQLQGGFPGHGVSMRG
uniref:Eukaryotic peptide chain release factor subunit 1 n=1 Tax=Gouania willdenowi TaxID=441366 RepID=A0A8C5D5W3_GOUWI